MSSVQLQRAADVLKRSERLVVLSGAGMSKESGIPTFRDAMEGLWAQFDPEELATPRAFQRNPRLVWEWYESRRLQVLAVQPHAGHYALAALEARLAQVVVITQNVDGLHKRAGSTDVIELHGNITQHKCSADCRGAPTLLDLAALSQDSVPPRCPYCGAYARPNVVWFEEYLPEDALSRAMSLCANADVVLIVGTSGIVQPAASLPYLAKRNGRAFLIDVNPERDEIAPICDLYLQGTAGSILPRLVALISA
ncbi:MAG: NAD-dependent protein deacylase [Candidatus Thermofonsia Clade 1 bacterium]|uniref:NAD-dependent protein deacylase n=1 Tax=Candidatus Thermofonsia Clade 1 bacterium TaxID=2364210 RepID=A0A2M8PI95_9CHLR|nr:MAG: NAD-dependent protein deacylase [Candidatus Thermofonsia Clade 1 bacterium]RMF52287.1 MAG: NAD-dependent deacylase [Chloroflexota bacterium]